MMTRKSLESVGVALFILLGIFILAVRINYAFFVDHNEQSSTHEVQTIYQVPPPEKVGYPDIPMGTPREQWSPSLHYTDPVPGRPNAPRDVDGNPVPKWKPPTFPRWTGPLSAETHYERRYIVIEKWPNRCWIDLYEVHSMGGLDRRSGDPWDKVIVVTEEGMAFDLGGADGIAIGWYYNDNQREWLLRNLDGGNHPPCEKPPNTPKSVEDLGYSIP